MQLKTTLRACLPQRRTLAAARPVLLGLSLLAAAAGAQAPADVRVALVIGNSAYAESPLLNPANDAKAMSAALTGLGFKVIELRDGGKEAMDGAVKQVSAMLKDKRGVGMFY
ncbi:MAG: caspase family protein, partial [Comamonadaceae bacterium]